MLVVDKPSFYDMPTDYGTFVVIALDPVASVAALRDEQATQEAAAMLPGRYLALVDLLGPMRYSRKMEALELSLSFILAGRGLPNPPYSKAAIPIAPAPAHPELDRAPVHASSPLPWSDFHFHTLDHLSAPVSRFYPHSTLGPSFSEEGHDEIRYISATDIETFPYYGINEESEDRWQQGSDVAFSVAHPEYDEDDCRSAGPDDPALFPIQFTGDAQEMRVHVQMWLDITAFDHLDCPENIHAEQRRLVQIERDWAHRTVKAIMSKEPQTKAWLEGAAGADVPEQDEDVRSVEPDEDALLGPEDAIEHRAERMMSFEVGFELDSQLDVHEEERSVSLVSSSAGDMSISHVSTHESLSTSAGKSDSCGGAVGPTNWVVFSAFRHTFVHLGSILSHARSFFWSLLCRRPRWD